MKPWKHIEPTTETMVGWRVITSKTFLGNHGQKPVEVHPLSISQLIENTKHGKMTDAAAVLMAYDNLMNLQENV